MISRGRVIIKNVISTNMLLMELGELRDWCEGRGVVLIFFRANGLEPEGIERMIGKRKFM
jgi:hypothetical protein